MTNATSCDHRAAPDTGPSQATAAEQAAGRLLEAARSGVPCAPVRDLIGDTDVDAAYAVQQRVVADRLASGAVVVGRKIGLTSPAVQAQLGVDQPDFGVLFDDMDVSAHATAVPTARLLQPKVEAEVAFVLAHDLIEGDLRPDQVRAAVDYAVPALEIVDSRVAGWDITFGDTVADNASGGLYVLGTSRRALDDFAPGEVQMEMTINDTVVSSGTGAACLGDPLNALAWLAAAARDHGRPLLAGQVVLSGALGPMAPVSSGDTVTASISGLGTVTATFAISDTSDTARAQP